MRLHIRIALLQRADQFLDLLSLRARLLIGAGRAGVGKVAGALDEVISSSRIRYSGRISSMPGKFVLWSFGIMVWTCAP